MTGASTHQIFASEPSGWEVCWSPQKPFIFYLFLVGVTVQSAESLLAAIPLGTSTKRANSKRANHGNHGLFQDAVPSVSFWLRSFPVCGWWTRSLSSSRCHNRCLQHGLGCYMQCAGSLGALDGAPTALAHQLPRAFGSASSLAAVLGSAVRQACVGSYGQHCGCLVHQPVGRSMITPHVISSSIVTFCSNRCALSTFWGSSSVQPMCSHDSSRDETIRLIWSRFGEAQVDLFASHESSHYQQYFSLTEGPLGTDALAQSWPQVLRKYAFTAVSLLAQTLCKLREDEEQVLMVALCWPTRT